MATAARHLSDYAVSGYDPTRTLTLRNAFARDITQRFVAVRRAIVKAVVDEDCFGLMPLGPRLVRVYSPSPIATPGAQAFAFPRSQDKVKGFMTWLKRSARRSVLELEEGILVGDAIDTAWTNMYVQSGYQKGILRARQELQSVGYPKPPDEFGGMQAVFNQPFHVDRLGVLYTRTFSELEGITEAMDKQISRVLTQGIAEGRNPRYLARELTKTIKGGRLELTDRLGRNIPAQVRANMLARTEIIRAHHQAMVQEYRNYGVVGVKVRAEWQTAGDRRVCEQCMSLEGRIFTLDEIEGMIPLHPQCRCVALPVVESTSRRDSRR